SSLPWRQASFAVLGLAATAPDRHGDQLGSVACVPVERGKAIIAKAFEATLRPGEPALETIVEALTGRVLVAHGASRHTGFLSAVFEDAGLRLCGPVLDTAVLAAWVPPRGPSNGAPSWSRTNIPPGLSDAASAMGLPVHRPQEAAGEALTTAQLFMAVVGRVDQGHPPALDSLTRLCSQKRGLQPRGHSVRLSGEEEYDRPAR